GCEKAAAIEDFAMETQFRLWVDRIRAAEDLPFEVVDETNRAAIISALDRLDDQSAYLHLNRKLSEIVKRGDLNANLRQKIIDEVLDDDYFSKQIVGSDTQRIKQVTLLAMSNFLVGRWENCIESSNELNGLYAETVVYATNEAGGRLSLLFNIASLHISTYNRKAYLSTIKEADKVISRSAELPEAYQRNIRNLKRLLTLRELVTSGMLNEALKQVNLFYKDRVLLQLDELEARTAMLIIAQIHFLLTDYSGAIKFLTTEVFPDNLDYNDHVARWIELLCHFMLDDKVLFDSRYRSMQYYLKKTDSGYSWDKLVLSSLGKAYGKQAGEKATMLGGLNRTLIPLEEEMRVSLSGTFDFMLWTQSIEKNVPMINLIKEKFVE
ncbi:MAG: hypothetical protein JKX84_06670, partial [Flavobacteriales bacterium]|nr:hypothetical protein [Flavobacteriales bacterium]